MNHQPLQVVWRIKGDSYALSRRLNLNNELENPRLDLHAGLGTLDDARMEGAEMTLLSVPPTAPDPLIAFATTDIFDETDIFDSDGPLLVVGPAFLAEFDTEIATFCHLYTVRVVMNDVPNIVRMNRAELLKVACPDVELYAIAPDHQIAATRPVVENNLLFVADDDVLPPFFRVPWRIGTVFISDDVRQRIDRNGLRGAEYNFLAIPRE